MEKVSAKELLEKDIKGKIVCFPTDTVYGVGAIYNDLEAIDKIYEMKDRSRTKPLAILCPNKNIDKYVNNLSVEAKELMKEWPGALTLIFKRSSFIPKELVCGAETVAFRMPDSTIALSILNHFGPMATTSVNKSGEKELNSLEDIASEFGDFIDYLVTDEAVFSGHPSKIVDCSCDTIKIIRS